MSGFIDNLPDITNIVNNVAGAQGTIASLRNGFDNLEPQNSESPLAGLMTVFYDLEGVLNIDTRQLTTNLPNGIGNLQSSLPSNALGYVESLGDIYQNATNYLQESPLAQQIPEGGNLLNVALSVISEALSHFDVRINELTDNLIDPAALGKIRATLESVDQFRTDFPSHQAEFLPFITNYLMGVAPDVFDAPLAHVQSALAVFSPITETELSTTLVPLQQTASTVYNSLLTSIASFDVADPAVYAQIQNHLDQLQNANTQILPAIANIYQELNTLITSHVWESVFTEYTDLLEAITLGDVISVDDIIDTMTGALNDMIARIFMTFDVSDIQARLELFNQSIRETFTDSPLGQIQDTITSFLDDVRGTIDGIPTGEVQTSVEDMLGEVSQIIDDLNLEQIQLQVNQAFTQVNTFIEENINTTLTQSVQTALTTIVSQVESLPITTLLTDLTNAIAQVQTTVEDMETTIQSEMDTLSDFTGRLEILSFQPISEEVIEEINELEQRLASINPNALSDAEKLLLKGALAVLDAIDLEGMVIEELKEGYHSAERQVKSILEQLTVALERIREKIDGFSPENLLQPVFSGLDEASEFIDQLNARALLSGLYDKIDELQNRLEDISPGRLLDPLQGSYDSMMTAVNRLDPGEWVAPLYSLYDLIDQLIDYIDVTPVLDDLDERQRNLFANARTAVLNALDDISLPEPLNSFFNAIRPVMELMTDAIFAEPDTQLRQLSIEIRDNLKVSALFAPLDNAFDDLVNLLHEVPEVELVDTMETIRQSIGIGLQTLNPHRVVDQFNSASGKLAELAPTYVIKHGLKLPTLREVFENNAAEAPPERQADVQAVLDKFDAVFAAVDPVNEAGQTNQLIQNHIELRNTLQQRINVLNIDNASEKYLRLNNQLDKLLPDFLRQNEALTHQDIIAGIYAMRPSNKAEKFDQALERLLQKINPLEQALETEINAFFGVVREVVNLFNPVSIKDSVEAIYTAIRDKVQILDPEALETAINGVLGPLLSPLEALNPTAIKEQINATFENALNALTGAVKSILDDIAGVVDERLRAIKTALNDLIGAIDDTLSTAIGSLESIFQRIEDFIFVDLLGRLTQVIDNLGASFDTELDRVRNAFDEMLAAIPLDNRTQQAA